MTFLTAKPFDFTDRYPLDTDFIEGIFHFVQFERFYYGFDKFHDFLPLSYLAV